MQSKIVAYAGYVNQGPAKMMLTINNVFPEKLESYNKDTIKENCRSIAKELGRDFSHCELITVEVL